MVRGQYSKCERMRAQSVPRHRIQLHAVGIDALINEMRRRHLAARTDRTVAIQVLMETGLDRLQRGARSRHGGKSIREVIAVIVGDPHRILIGAWHLPGHLIPARRLLRANRRYLAKLTGHIVRALVFQRWARAATAVKIKVGADLSHAGRSDALDHRLGRRYRRCRRTNRTVAVQVLMETGLDRLQRGARSRHGGKSIREVIAVIVGDPHRILIGAWHLPGHLIPARRLLRANRRYLAKLTGHIVRALVFQRWARAATAVKIKVGADLSQAGRSEALDHRLERGWRRCRKTNRTVAVQVLMETGLDRLQRGARSRHGGKSI